MSRESDSCNSYTLENYQFKVNEQLQAFIFFYISFSFCIITKNFFQYTVYRAAQELFGFKQFLKFIFSPRKYLFDQIKYELMKKFMKI